MLFSAEVGLPSYEVGWTPLRHWHEPTLPVCWDWAKEHHPPEAWEAEPPGKQAGSAQTSTRFGVVWRPAASSGLRLPDTQMPLWAMPTHPWPPPSLARSREGTVTGFTSELESQKEAGHKTQD